MQACSRWMAILLTIATVLAAPLVRAADPAPAGGEGYAVLSLIGDRITIVTFRESVGSSLDRNLRQSVPTPGGSFDRVAANAVATAVVDARPGSKTTVLDTDDPALYDRSAELAASPENLKPVAEPVAKEMAADGTRWLVLVTKWRGPARLEGADGAIGSGALDGLGFYIDRFHRTPASETGASGIGFLAPYAYFALHLVDLTTGRVVRSETVQVAVVLPDTRNDRSLHPWDVLTGAEKQQRLEALIRQGVAGAIPRLLTPPR